jgi:hypothetical protein
MECVGREDATLVIEDHLEYPSFQNLFVDFVAQFGGEAEERGLCLVAERACILSVSYYQQLLPTYMARAASLLTKESIAMRVSLNFAGFIP